MPLGHVGLPVSDLKASTAFYASAIAPLGYCIQMELGGQCAGFGPKRGVPDFWLGPEKKNFDARSAPTHVAFQVSSKKMVHDFYKAALKAGAKDNGPPGERPHYTKGYYAAYVLDPDGHNIECMSFRPWWMIALQQAPTLLGVSAVGLAWWAGRNGWMLG